MSRIDKKLFSFMNIVTITILFFVVGLYLVNICSRSYDSALTVTCMKVLGILGIIQLISSIISWRYLTRSLLCPYIMFLSIAYVFTFGQSILMPFNLVTDTNNLLMRVQPLTLLRAEVFTLLGLGFFHLGALYGYKKKEYRLSYNEESSIYISLKYIGLLFLFISIIPYFYIMLNQIFIVGVYGYVGLYDESLVRVGISSIIIKISEYYIPSLICLFIVYSRQKKHKLITMLLLLHILMRLYLGDRSTAMVLLITVLLLYHYLINQINKPLKVVMLGLILWVILSFLSIIGDVRADAGRTFIDYFEAFFLSFGKNNFISSILTEMGGSMFPLAKVMELVPDYYDFRYGESYIYSLGTLIPNLSFNSVHFAAKYTQLGQWLQKVLNMGYGPGFSMFAETYINFGWFGFAFSFLQGCMTSKIFTFVDINNCKKRPDLFCFMMVFFNLVVMTIRNSFASTVRSIVYFALAFYILSHIIQRRTFKKLN